MSGQPLLCNFIDLVKDIPKRESTDPKYFLSKKINAFVHSEQSKAKQALIFTRNIDPEADSVGVELLRRGINYVRLNIEDIPLNVQVKYSFEKDCHVKIGLKIQDEIVDISNIYVVLYRHFDINTVKFHDQEIINTFSLQQWEDTCQILQSNLTCEWINDFDATNRASGSGIATLFRGETRF